MAELRFECSIDGQAYPYEHLAAVQHERHLHVLHELKRLGASVTHKDKTLSFDEVNLLNPQDARAISIATRQAYGVDGLWTLFKAQMRASDEMWKRADDALEGGEPQIASADVTITGISYEGLHGAMSIDRFHQTYPQLNPDHFFAYRNTKGVHAMETFGMYDGPSEVYAIVDPTVSVPIERDAGYPLLIAGYTTLASDGTKVNIVAFHQLKPLDNGLAVKLGCVFPPHTPRELVDGIRYIWPFSSGKWLSLMRLNPIGVLGYDCGMNLSYT